MGQVSAELVLRNVVDVGCVRRGIMKTEDVHSVTLTALVDTGAYSLMIPLETMQLLGLQKTGEQKVHIASGEVLTCPVTDEVEINWKDRQTAMRAVAIPGLKQTLLGFLPMEAMDLMIHPKKQELVGVHGEEMEFMALAAVASGVTALPRLSALLRGSSCGVD